MEGFFRDEDTRAEGPARTVSGCGACGLRRKCKSPKMAATGRGKVPILFVAEAPGREEDERGEQLVGPVGRYFRRLLEQIGITLDDCRKINAVNCRPPKNQNPKPLEIEHCRPRILQEIEKSKPRVIILLGSHAVRSVIGNVWKKDLGGISKWRGWRIPDRHYGAWVCPTFHPSFVKRHMTSDAAEVILKRDLKRAVTCIKKKLPKWKDERESVQVCKDPITAAWFLDEIIESEPKAVAIDYETTGLKPQAEGHKIATVAISTGPKHAFAFPYNEDAHCQKLRKILRNRQIGKIASNMKFEELWTRAILGCRVRGWQWDTMQASHVLDNRRGITSVKFQTYVRLGVGDYDSSVHPYLMGRDAKDANSFNRIDEAPLDELLLYNGLDALYEYKTAVAQRKEIKQCSSR